VVGQALVQPMDTDTPRENCAEAGLILAAGLGSRLDAAKGGSRLKPLLELDGQTLIGRVISGMERAGCRRVIVVTGYLAEELESEVKRLHQGPAELSFVRNERYEKSNGLSVLAASQALEGPFLLSMSDHLLSDDLWRLAKNHRPLKDGAALLVDYKIASVFDLDDATKVRAEGARLVAIGKQLEDYNCIDCGLFVVTQGLVRALDEVARQNGDASLSQGVAELAQNGRMEVVDIGDGFWADIDTPEMLADAIPRLPRG
jgi:1L-myo-inositol 1-phosphate cytidylyltransferase